MKLHFCVHEIFFILHEIMYIPCSVYQCIYNEAIQLLFQQRLCTTLMPTLARHNSLFFLTMWLVLDQNPDWWTAPMTVTLQTAHTPRMLVLVVIQVCLMKCVMVVTCSGFLFAAVLAFVLL